MKATPNEIKLLKESAIAEYKLKMLSQMQKNRSTYHDFVIRLKKIVPLNIVIGIIASVVLVYVSGWKTLIYLLLSGIIWLTLISTVVSAFLKENGK